MRIRSKLASLLAMACVIASLLPSPVQAGTGPTLMVADFNNDIQNHLGGYYNKFEALESSASTFLTSDIYRGAAGRSLRVTANRGGSGFCGVWMHLFDFRDPNSAFFDARRYEYLSFWIKGARGGEEFSINLADRSWIRREDSLAVGLISDFLPGGVTTQWQEVLVPLKLNRRIDLENLGGITLDFSSPGDYSVFIDDVSFKTTDRASTPVTKTASTPTTRAEPLPQAMWVWNTEPLLNDHEKRRELFEFCREHRIGSIWMQLLYAFKPEVDLLRPLPPGGVDPATRCIIKTPDLVRDFLKDAHANGLKVHVLEGYPEFAQRDYHRLPLAVVDAVIDFNKNSATPEERYDGVHFDNEPYLLVGWQDPSRRETILQDFLTVTAECQRRVSAKSDMQFGVDIPFWWNEADHQTGKSLGEVTFRGVSKPASFHCVDFLDNVGIMNYRDTADGADGMIVHGRDVLAYADKVDGAEVYIGIETFAYTPTQTWFAVGLPKDVFNALYRDPESGLNHLSRINGFRIQTFNDGVNVHVGIEVPDDPSPKLEEKIRTTMLEIAARFGASCRPALRTNATRARHRAKAEMARDGQWLKPHDRDIPTGESLPPYAGIGAIRIMLPKVTFGDNTFDDIQTQTAAAEEYFQRYKSYHGIAIHYYATYRRMAEEAKAKSAASGD